MKKTGTEKDIPIIKNGGYLVDNKGNKDTRHIKGFMTVAQEKYGMTKQEAEDAIQYFLRVIEDASNYLFSRNHSLPYSMIGFFIGWLRYYHTIELLTAALNIYVDNREKSSNIKEYIKSKGIEIKNVKFGKSKAHYFMSKEENAIYQGVGSIKQCNDKIGEELYKLSQEKHYDNFFDLYVDIRKKTSTPRSKLEILTLLNFFSDFGNNKKLLASIELIEELYSAKIIKKDKIFKLGIDEDVVKKHSKKETLTQYREIDNIGLIKELMDQIENKPLSIKEQIKAEQNYLENIVYKNPKSPKNMYYVVEMKFYKDKTKPYLMLYDLKNGEYLKTKITSGKSFVEKPFKEGNVLHVKDFKPRNKMKRVNGDWVKTGETEQVVMKWDVY